MDIEEVLIIKPNVIEDNRGSFYRAFCDKELDEVLNNRIIKQINISTTKHVGAIRGLHFQFPPFAEMKLIRCLSGKVWDVAVDLRRNSSTFLKWKAAELSADNHQMVIIPEGFAHGFQVLEADSKLLYLHTAAFEPKAEGGVRYDDPILAINWPISITDISSRDANHPFLNEDFQGIKI